MIEQLAKAVQEKGTSIVVGLDPQLQFIPESLKKAAIEDRGESLFAVSDSFLRFNLAIIDAVCDLVPAVKLQIAMYERFGTPGIEAYRVTAKYAKEKGLVVIGDVKRNDIGVSAEGYADSHLGTVKFGHTILSALETDMCTVNPYLGSDGIEPFLKVCREKNKGIFVLVKTSNPSSGEFQDLKLASGEMLCERVAAKVSEWGSTVMHGDWSDVGAVVGATYPEFGRRMRELMPRTWILVPGYGAQGGKGADLVPFFDKDGLGAIVNSSRGIIAAWKQEEYKKYGEEHFEEASRAAVQAMREDIAKALDDAAASRVH
ncbi:MAG: orotidine-5'-phosphate decarboxylase [Lachnospiraceae bacterium]|nr:orotidine-5'-phosphate decarboxylase [Lachnospiraceae bacterium]